MMDAGEMAVEVGDALDGMNGWDAIGLDLGEVFLTNADGEKFVLLVTRVDKFPDED